MTSQLVQAIDEQGQCIQRCISHMQKTYSGVYWAHTRVSSISNGSLAHQKVTNKSRLAAAKLRYENRKRLILSFLYCM